MTDKQEAAARKLAEKARKRALSNERDALKGVEKLRPLFRGSDASVIDYCGKQIQRILDGRRIDHDGRDIVQLRESRAARLRTVELRKGNA